MNQGVRVIVVNADEEVASDLRAVLLSIGGVRIVAEVDEPALLAQALSRMPAEVLLVHLDPNPAGMMDVVAPLIEAHKGHFAAIAMTEDRDAELVMRAMRAGMKEFLWKPFPPEQLSEILQRVAREASGAGRQLGRVISVVGTNGGVGATSLMINLAVELAQLEWHRRLGGGFRLTPRCHSLYSFLKGLLMALIRYAEGQQRSGSIGASTYSHNRFGQYIRARSVPVNPNTDRQVAIRNSIRSLTIAWQNILTQVQRDAWDVYGDNVNWTNKFGETVNLTGLNHYVRTNTQMVALGFARTDVAPTIFNLATAELALGCTASEATQLLSFTFDDTEVWATEVGAFQHFYMGIPQNAAITFFNGPFRYVVSVAGVTPAVSPLPAAAPFPFAEGQRIWVRSRIMRADGRLSEFAQLNFLGAA